MGCSRGIVPDSRGLGGRVEEVLLPRTRREEYLQEPGAEFGPRRRPRCAPTLRGVAQEGSSHKAFAYAGPEDPARVVEGVWEEEVGAQAGVQHPDQRGGVDRLVF